MITCLPDICSRYGNPTNFENPDKIFEDGFQECAKNMFINSISICAQNILHNIHNTVMGSNATKCTKIFTVVALSLLEIPIAVIGVIEAIPRLAIAIITSPALCLCNKKYEDIPSSAGLCGLVSLLQPISALNNIRQFIFNSETTKDFLNEFFSDD